MQNTCTTVSSAACPAVQYFIYIISNRHDFLKRVIEHKMWVVICCTIFVWNISRTEKNWAK